MNKKNDLSNFFVSSVVALASFYVHMRCKSFLSRSNFAEK